MGHTISIFLDFSKTNNRFLTPICPEPAIGTPTGFLEIVFCTCWSRGLFFKILGLDFEPFFVFGQSLLVNIDNYQYFPTLKMKLDGVGLVLLKF